MANVYAGPHLSSELYAGSYTTYSKALRSICHATLLVSQASCFKALSDLFLDFVRQTPK
jgi:hypothetical protein